MNGDKEIRELAKSFLRERKTSVSSLARISGVSQTTINDQLNGNAKIGMQTIVALLDAFPDLSAEWLLRGEGEMLRTNGCDIVINNSNSHHNNNNAGNGTQIIGSDIEVWKRIVAEKNEQIAELKKDKELLGNLLQALTHK